MAILNDGRIVFEAATHDAIELSRLAVGEPKIWLHLHEGDPVKRPKGALARDIGPDHLSSLSVPLQSTPTNPFYRRHFPFTVLFL